MSIHVFEYIYIHIYIDGWIYGSIDIDICMYVYICEYAVELAEARAAQYTPSPTHTPPCQVRSAGVRHTTPVSIYIHAYLYIYMNIYTYLYIDVYIYIDR